MNQMCPQLEGRDDSQGNACSYGDAGYWDRRYQQNSAPFDWYQRYSGVAHLMERYIPKSSRILMAGCGNAALSEDMVEDGYQDIINIDISSVVIDMMKKKYQNIPQLKYMIMDVQDLSFSDNSFDAVIDKGTLDSLMCGANAPFSAARMLLEVSRVLKSHGVYMLITYGDPGVRMPHLNVPDYNWTITLYIIPRPVSENAIRSTSRGFTDPVPLNDDGSYVQPFMLDGPDCHYVYVCVKGAYDE